MNNLETLLLFVLVFSSITTLRLIFRFISALVQNPPQKLKVTTGELIFYGFCISYIITYFIKN